MVNKEEVEFKAGALLKLQPSMDWHNAYVLNASYTNFNLNIL